MNKLIAFLLLGATAFAAPTTFKTDILEFGKPATGNKTLTFRRGSSATNPGFKWNESTAAMQFTNDGSTYFNLVSGVANSVVVSKTANYTATTTDDIVLANAAGGAFTITLPTAVGNTGKVLTVKKTDSNVFDVTVTGTGGQTIDGITSWRLGHQYQVLTVASDGSNWAVQKFDPANENLTQSGTTVNPSQCTPNIWIPMNNNSITLKSGDWRVHGLVDWSGSNAWSTLEILFAGGNGVGGSNSPTPTAFAGTVTGGLTGAFHVSTINGGSNFGAYGTGEILVHVAPGASNALFIDSFVNGCTGISMTITSNIFAERVR